LKSNNEIASHKSADSFGQVLIDGKIIQTTKLNCLSKIKPYNMYNLFSNFGNIDLIVFDLTNNDNQKLTIQFENINYAKVAFRYLNNIRIYGFYMRM